MIGLPAWGAKQGYGSFLTLKFGAPRVIVAERKKNGRTVRHAYVTGEWHLWVYCCHWQVMIGEECAVSSEDDRDTIARVARQLDGQKLLSIQCDPTDACCGFDFDLGGSLRTRPYGKDPLEEQWHVMSESECFAFRADGQFSFGSNTVPGGQESWSRLD